MGVAYREGVVLHKYCVWHGHMIRLAGHDSGLVCTSRSGLYNFTAIAI